MNKYGIINIAFLILLFALNIGALLTVSQSVIILIPLTFLVVYRKTRYYQWFTFVGGATIIIIIAGLVIGEINLKKDLAYICSFIIIAIIFILFGVIMPDHLTPGPELKKKQNPD